VSKKTCRGCRPCCRIFFDGFNRDAGTDIGNLWSEVSGDWDIVAPGQLHIAAPGLIVVDEDPLTNRYQLDVIASSNLTSGANYGRLILAYLDTDNYVEVQFPVSIEGSGNVFVFERYGGVNRLVSSGQPALAANGVMVMRACIDGNNGDMVVRIRGNGSPFANANDYSFVTSGLQIAGNRFGLGAGISGGGPVDLDFESFEIRRVTDDNDCEQCQACSSCPEGSGTFYNIDAQWAGGCTVTPGIGPAYVMDGTYGGARFGPWGAGAGNFVGQQSCWWYFSAIPFGGWKYIVKVTQPGGPDTARLMTIETAAGVRFAKEIDSCLIDAGSPVEFTDDDIVFISGVAACTSVDFIRVWSTPSSIPSAPSPMRLPVTMPRRTLTDQGAALYTSDPDASLLPEALRESWSYERSKVERGCEDCHAWVKSAWRRFVEKHFGVDR
jgi:hypothetical protein